MAALPRQEGLKSMFRLSKFCLFPLAVALIAAPEGSPWETKDLKDWNDKDAKQVLADSPWVKNAKIAWVRDLSVNERRDSGDWEAGGGHGVGIAGTGILGDDRMEAAIRKAHEKPDMGEVAIRWESASPVRTAERIQHEADIPTWQGEYYAIAVYDMPTPHRWNLANELKGVSYLRRAGKKDIRPSKVIISRQTEERATIVYLFPRSIEITKKDGTVEFGAQVGRLFVSQHFFTTEMLILGILEL
jgi:hypothetical protein